MEMNTEAEFIKESLKIQDFLDELLDRKESRDIEFKSAKGGFPGSFWETYSSFANTEGGTIVFGVREKHGIFSVDPLSEDTVANFKKKFFDLQHDHEKVNAPLLTDDDIAVEPYGEGYVMAFFIPRASREQRPVYIGLNPMSGTYRRDHEGDYLCEPSTVSQMFADRKNNEVLQEAQILPNYSWDDIDMESFRQFRTIFTNMTPSHPWTVKDDLELMKLLGGYRKDRRKDEEGFTLAGILMFGKTEAITDVACLPDFMLDYREIPIDTSITRWSDRLYPDGTWRGTTYKLNKDFVQISDLASSDSVSSDSVSSDCTSSDCTSSDSVSSDCTSSDSVSSDCTSSDSEITADNMIVDFCKYQWRTSRQISLSIGRDPSYVRKRIKILIVEGKLKMEFPNQPTHPAQRYRTVNH